MYGFVLALVELMLISDVIYDVYDSVTTSDFGCVISILKILSGGGDGDISCTSSVISRLLLYITMLINNC